MIDIASIDFAKGDGLVPAIVQHARTGQVLMLGYMNEAAVRQSSETGLVTFFSRSKQRLWTKGETSGNTLALSSIETDCDSDALLVKAIPAGPVCHTGTPTCFAGDMPPGLSFLDQLEDIIDRRADADPADSYVARLNARGISKIAQKVGEEGVETALAAVAEGEAELTNEAADLLFHLMVLLRSRGVTLADVTRSLRDRHAQASK